MELHLRASGVKTMLKFARGMSLQPSRSSVLAGEAPESVVRARRQAITPAECARAIRRGVERDARTVLAPKVGWLLVGLARLFPGLVEARMAEMNGTA